MQRIAMSVVSVMCVISASITVLAMRSNQQLVSEKDALGQRLDLTTQDLARLTHEALTAQESVSGQVHLLETKDEIIAKQMAVTGEIEEAVHHTRCLRGNTELQTKLQDIQAFQRELRTLIAAQPRAPVVPALSTGD